MKKFLVSIILFFSVNSIFSQIINFKLCPILGFSISNVNEFVYNKDLKESHLEWKNYKPFIGINAICLIQNFIIDFKAQNAIPVTLGSVTDKDFSETNAISMYSYHNLITNKDYSFELNLSYNFIFPIFNIGLGLSGVYSNIKMEAVDGYLQYPIGNDKWTGNESKQYLNGTVISYEQSRFMLGLLISLQKQIKYFSFGLTGNFYPFVRIDCIDNHFLRSIQFLDSLQNGCAFKVKACIEWKIKNDFWLFFNTDYSFAKANGNTFINSLGIITHETTKVEENYSAATSYYDLNLTFGFIIKI